MVVENYQIDAKTDALVVIDVQRDFCEVGALPVPAGDEVVVPLNRWLRVGGLLKIATRDWHPLTHTSLQRNRGPWPDHCIQGTPGAGFHPELAADRLDEIVSTGTEPQGEGYSGFENPQLFQILRDRGVRRLWMGGLATEYCVKATALDGRKQGFEVFIIEDAIRGIDVNPGDCDRARQEMEAAGVHFVRTEQVSPVSEITA